MGLALLSLLAMGVGLASPQGQPELAEAVATALRAGDYAAASRLAGGAQQPALAARLEAEVRWTAGDLDGALAAAQEGLRAVPGDPRLASTAADLALTLGLAAEARRHLEALDESLTAALLAEGADEETQRWWRERRAGLEGLAIEAEARLVARDRALRRARMVGGGMLALGAAAFLWLLGRPRPGPVRIQVAQPGDRPPHPAR